MKLGKEFASQMVPEWQQTYIGYEFLENLLKDILKFRERTKHAAQKSSSGGLKMKKGLSFYRAFSGLTQKKNPCNNVDIENQQEVLVTSSVNQQNGSQRYQTAFLMASHEGGEFELVYFKKLDDELNKVNNFYKSKVGEVLKEAETLKKHMDALIAFRIKVENPIGWSRCDREELVTRLASDVAASATALDASTPSRVKAGSKFMPSPCRQRVLNFNYSFRMNTRFYGYTVLQNFYSDFVRR